MARMATAADTGSLHVDDLVSQQLRAACTDIAAIRRQLATALGSQTPDAAARLRARFHGAATEPEDWQ